MRTINFFRPGTIADAADLLRDHDAVPLAGGTDLVIELRDEKFDHNAVVDLTAIADLQGVRMQGEHILIGACTSFTAVAQHPLIRAHAPILAAACNTVGSPQIRNRGTVGGNLMNGSPAADSVPVLAALEAEAIFTDGCTDRVFPLAEMPGNRKSLLRRGEFLRALRFCPLSAGTQWAFVKLGRRSALSISRLNISFLAPAKSGTITNAKIILGAVGLKPERALAAEKVLCGMNRQSDFLPVAQLLRERVEELLGARPTAAYKQKAVMGIGFEAFEQLWENQRIQ